MLANKTIGTLSHIHTNIYVRKSTHHRAHINKELEIIILHSYIARPYIHNVYIIYTCMYMFDMIRYTRARPCGGNADTNNNKHTIVSYRQKSWGFALMFVILVRLSYL